MTRQVVLDTETTGLEPAAGHRIIEIGCVEIIDRRLTRKTFHRYLNPDRAVEAGALEVHGIDDDFLAEQPRFRDVVGEFLEFVRGAELVIHNADFDVEFINHELRLLGGGVREIRDDCAVLDTLALARRMHPGQRNSLDALAKRYDVDNSKRELHGALLDAQILADIYLAMTGGQVSLSLDGDAEHEAVEAVLAVRISREGLALPVLRAAHDEQAAHDGFLARIRKKCGGPTVWERVLVTPTPLDVAPHDAAVAASVEAQAAATVEAQAAATVEASTTAATVAPAAAAVGNAHPSGAQGKAGRTSRGGGEELRDAPLGPPLAPSPA